MLFHAGHRVEVDGRKGHVVAHLASESHLVVVRYDDGGIFKVGMHRVRLLDEGLQLRCDAIHQPVDDDELRARRQTRPAGNVDVVKPPEPLEPA